MEGVTVGEHAPIVSSQFHRAFSSARRQRTWLRREAAETPVAARHDALHRNPESVMNRIAFLAAALLAAPAFAQGPARYDILAACPQLAEQLPEQLASAKTEYGREGTVRVQLVLDERGLQRIEQIDGPRRYQSRVRSALQGIECKPAVPQRYVLNIRFDDGFVPSTTTQLASAPAR
jgi:hypothetical protein